MPSWKLVTYNVAASLGPNRPEQANLWLELCARLEQVVSDPRYADILASGDGVPRRRRDL